MRLNLPLLTRIVYSFAVTTGVPAFLIDSAAKVHSPSPGFCTEDYRFADTDQLRKTVVEGLRRESLASGQYHTLYTVHQFIYNLVPVDLADSGPQVLVAGPMRLARPTDRELQAIAPRRGPAAQPADVVAERIQHLPQVPLSRVQHLGRVQAALCWGYSEAGGPVPARIDEAIDTSLGSEAPGSRLTVNNSEGASSDVPPVSFTLLEEEAHFPYEFLVRIKDLVLTGDVDGIRELWEEIDSAPVDRLIETDAVRSVRYNLIATCGVLVGMMFDQGLPYEQLMMTADRHIREVDTTDDLNELMNLIRQAVENFAGLSKRYSARNYSRPVRQVLQYIQANMSSKISLEDLAGLTQLSAGYLSRLIKRETGMTLSDIVNSQRVNESKFLLLRTEYSILEIAHMVGYTYQNHFAERFKARTGMTPSYYRRAGRREVRREA
ncbi:MAG: helix-turn-helix transcriptional regulator [Spirochaetota bacterium]